jgi:16S rRNA (guanine527-N7)-methyltransferase
VNALAELAISFDLLPAQIEALESYLDLVSGWRAGNVTGVRGREAVVRTLLADSLALLDVPEVRSAGAAPELPWADLGAGAGIPGLPLAVAFPRVRLALLESVGKKCAFLRAAVHEMDLSARVTVECARSEDHSAAGSPGREAYAIVLARAVGRLATVSELAAPLLAPGAALLVLTSAQRAEEEWATGEAAAAQCGLSLDRVEPLRRSSLEHSVCVVGRKLGPTPEWLPRRSGRARSHPLGTS